MRVVDEFLSEVKFELLIWTDNWKVWHVDTHLRWQFRYMRSHLGWKSEGLGVQSSPAAATLSRAPPGIDHVKKFQDLF